MVAEAKSALMPTVDDRSSTCVVVPGLGNVPAGTLTDTAASLPLWPWLSSTSTYEELRNTNPSVDSCSSPLISLAEWLEVCAPRHLLSSFVTICTPCIAVLESPGHSGVLTLHR